MTTAGYTYWLRLLAPAARAGYHQGIVDGLEVVLIQDVTGRELHLPRPSAKGHWERADLLLPAFDGPDPSEPDARAITYLMKRAGTDRMELTA